MTGHELREFLNGFTQEELERTVVVSTSVAIVTENCTKKVQIIEDVRSISTVFTNMGQRLGVMT